MSKVERVGFALLIALASVGLMTVGAAVMCQAGWSNACIVDLMPSGGDISCEKAPTKARKVNYGK